MSLIAPAPSFTAPVDPMPSNIDDIQPAPSPPWDGDSQPPPPSPFIANGGYIYMVLLMTFVIGTIYFCRVFAAKRRERLLLLKEQEMINQFQDGNGMNPPLYGHHDRDIPVVVVVVDDEHGYGQTTEPAPFYTARDPSATHGAAAGADATTIAPMGQSTEETEATAVDDQRHRRRSNRPIELQPVGPQTTTAHLASPAAVMVRGEPYAHILTPRTPSPAPRSTSLSATQTSSETAASSREEEEDRLAQHGQPPAYDDITSSAGHRQRQPMMISETRIGIGHHYPPSPGQRPLSKP
ncbi:hypothetical protein BGZ73_004321 [Actinomortierella ambigua]|nr:hypothetical protein BGZ73_004321 [Actinomortierella ambigua]